MSALSDIYGEKEENIMTREEATKTLQNMGFGEKVVSSLIRSLYLNGKFEDVKEKEEVEGGNNFCELNISFSKNDKGVLAKGGIKFKGTESDKAYIVFSVLDSLEIREPKEFINLFTKITELYVDREEN
jgi:hypothetical protein